MKCSNCGKEIIEPSQFCPDCGSAISQEAESEKPLPKKHRKGIIIALVSVVCVAVIAGLLFIMPSNSEDVVNPDSEPSYLDVQQIIDMCEEIPYNDLLRNPSYYLGNMVHFSGTVVRLMHESVNGQEYLVLLNNSSDYIYFTFNEENGSRLLEGDEAEIYGRFTGLQTFTTFLMLEETVPSVDGWYVEWQGM